MVVYRASKVFNAPIKYVYQWATDFREDDNLIWGGEHSRIILFKAKTKVVYAYYQDGWDGKPKLAVGIVVLSLSTYSWHLDYYSEEDLETGEYKLVRLGKEKTRLNMRFDNKRKLGKGPSREDLQEGTNSLWEKYAEALEKDYSSGKKASD